MYSRISKHIHNKNVPERYIQLNRRIEFDGGFDFIFSVRLFPPLGTGWYYCVANNSKIHAGS